VDEVLVSVLKLTEENQPERLQKMFAAGDKVQLTQGAFAGLEGIYQMADGESRAMVLIEILSKPVRIAVEPAELRKLA
jgi:transcriptional antiterminator RfaH